MHSHVWLSIEDSVGPQQRLSAVHSASAHSASTFTSANGPRSPLPALEPGRDLSADVGPLQSRAIDETAQGVAVDEHSSAGRPRCANETQRHPPSDRAHGDSGEFRRLSCTQPPRRVLERERGCVSRFVDVGHAGTVLPLVAAGISHERQVWLRLPVQLTGQPDQRVSLEVSRELLVGGPHAGRR